MIKKLFIEPLYLNYVSNPFHELSVILEIDGEVKKALQFKLKPESNGIDQSLIHSQGYTEEEIVSNPMFSYQAYNDLMRMFELYVNKSVPSDRLLICGWDGEYTFNAFNQFLYQNGCRNSDQYLSSYYVDIRSLFIQQHIDELYDWGGFDLKDVSIEILGESCKKDSLSRLVNVYKIYREMT